MEKNTNNDVKLSTILTTYFIAAVLSFPIYMKISAGDIGGSIGAAIVTGGAGVAIMGGIHEYVRRIRAGEPIIQDTPPKPKKAPWIIRVLDKIFS